MNHPKRWVGPCSSALIAIVAAAPGLAMPFISDDWINLGAVSERLPLRTPFDYFRPLYLASYWAELHVWGMRPAVFHLTNLVLMGACAALIVLVVRRFTGDPRWGTAAGILFALHPFHVENAAWIAARADSASAAWALVALLAYERWSRRDRGIPLGAIVAFEAAPDFGVFSPRRQHEGIAGWGASLADSRRQLRRRSALRGPCMGPQPLYDSSQGEQQPGPGHAPTGLLLFIVDA